MSEIPARGATLLLFVDGIGLGTRGAHNPFTAVARSVLAPLGGHVDSPVAGWSLQPLDASLGVPGLPQSASGTATILTGVNVAEAIGEHLFAFPDHRVRPILAEHSVLAAVRRAGQSSAYLNAFTEERALASADWSQKIHRGACTCAALAGGGTLYTLGDLEAGRAASFDLTHEVLLGMGISVAPITMRDAARALVRGAREVSLALFELFLTDKAGHSQDTYFAHREVSRTERLIEALTEEFDPTRDTILLVSDHGNLEDLSTRGHTMASVPALAWGRGSVELVRTMRSLTDITPALLRHVLQDI
ncbi:MAG: hypothetical protein Q8Q09_13555 [Deltaproteobacteria bacterium]|nr:hypothetical protein [Deltaproteobacteria bacterium]